MYGGFGAAAWEAWKWGMRDTVVLLGLWDELVYQAGAMGFYVEEIMHAGPHLMVDFLPWACFFLHADSCGRTRPSSAASVRSVYLSSSIDNHLLLADVALLHSGETASSLLVLISGHLVKLAVVQTSGAWHAAVWRALWCTRSCTGGICHSTCSKSLAGDANSAPAKPKPSSCPAAMVIYFQPELGPLSLCTL